MDLFLVQESNLRTFLSRYLDSGVEIQARDPILRLCFYWSEFTSALEFVHDPSHDEFFVTYQPHRSGGALKITCCDASKMIKSAYDDYENVIGFSATLKPFGYYAQLSGIDPDGYISEEFGTPFPKSQRKILIIPQISTRYSDRERNYPKIAEVIQRISALKSGNYFAFFPSFDFLERVYVLLQDMPGFTTIKQERDFKLKDVEAVIEHLRSQTWPTIVFAVQGGVFSEGVDYPGDTIIGAFVIGPPLPVFSPEREQMREYYQAHYRSGFDYTYTYPSMSKAVQAAGRVIRSETDKGIIILMDGRFIESTFSQAMPKDWYDASPKELISGSILAEISEFWANA
jgi:DNA excision repair protein ERCC-2